MAVLRDRHRLGQCPIRKATVVLDKVSVVTLIADTPRNKSYELYT